MEELKKENEELKYLIKEWEELADDKDKRIKELEAAIKDISHIANNI